MVDTQIFIQLAMEQTIGHKGVQWPNLTLKSASWKFGGPGELVDISEINLGDEVDFEREGLTSGYVIEIHQDNQAATIQVTIANVHGEYETAWFGRFNKMRRLSKYDHNLIWEEVQVKDLKPNDFIKLNNDKGFIESLTYSQVDPRYVFVEIRYGEVLGDYEFKTTDTFERLVLQYPDPPDEEEVLRIAGWLSEKTNDYEDCL